MYVHYVCIPTDFRRSDSCAVLSQGSSLSLSGFLSLIATSILHAATFTVDHTDDNADATDCDEGVLNDCSLRGAILKANAVDGDDSINVPTGIYTLTIPGDEGFDEQTGTSDDLDIKMKGETHAKTR